METNKENKYFLPASVLLAGLLIAGAVLWNGSRPAGTGGTGAPIVVDVKDVETAGDPFIGAVDAPVTIAFWSDYQCPFCKRFETETFPQIVENYVKTGKVKVVFMDFPFLGEDSIAGALYSRSVWKLYPEAYAAWHEAMMTAQDEEGDNGFGDAASIDALNATVAGLDAAKIAADVKANATAYKAAVDADRAEAQKVGVNATPSLIIGKELIQGAYPYAKFQASIEAALK